MEIESVTDVALFPGYTRAAAEISYKGSFRKELLWFEVPSSCKDGLDLSGNSWLVALLPLAFARGEPLRIGMPTDAALLKNTEKIQRIWAGWYPPLKPVPVEAGIATPQPPGCEKTGLFFTAGVDSFFR